jgi:ATP-dependent helicase HrpA
VADFDLSAVTDHLLMNFSVVDEKGRELGMGRDWNGLKAQLGSAAQLTFRINSPSIEKTGLKQWDFGDLPKTLTFSKDGHQLTGYPALEDNKDNVAVKLFDTETMAQKAHRMGVCRLMRFELKEQMKQLEKGLPQFNQYALLLRNLISPDDLREEMLLAISERAFIGEDDLPRTNAEFMNLKQRARTRLPAVVDASARLATNVAQEYQALTQKLNTLPSNMARIKKEIEDQLAMLLPKRFFSQTPWERMRAVLIAIRKVRKTCKWCGSVGKIKSVIYVKLMLK